MIGTDYATYGGPGPGPGGGYLDNQGQLINLGPVRPTAISGTGIVVGTTWDGNGFVYQGGQVASIPGNQANGLGVNDAGQVVGQYLVTTDSKSVEHAFLYQNGQFQDLGTLGGFRSWAAAINSQGQIVGTSDVVPNSFGLGHAFLDQNGTMIDLNTPVAATSGWTLQSATAINDKGQILGYGISPRGEEATFLLTPTSEPPPIAPQVPEPSMLAFFVVTAAVMAVRRARDRRRS